MELNTNLQTKNSPVHRLLKLIYPPRCVLCQRPGLGHLDICAACYKKLPWNSVCCPQCAMPLADKNLHNTLCGRCLHTQLFYDYTHSLFRYEADIVVMVHQFKFHQRLLYARLFGIMLAEMMAAIIAAPTEKWSQKPDCIIPVPLYPSRLRQRGFNQSNELAKVLSRLLQIPIDTGCVQRIRKTPTQTGLNASQRRKNIKGAFETVKPVSGRHILVIDDVITTGSTVNELAHVLKQSGAETVAVASIARA